MCIVHVYVRLSTYLLIYTNKMTFTVSKYYLCLSTSARIKYL